jgi:hypothetical protein
LSKFICKVGSAGEPNQQDTKNEGRLFKRLRFLNKKAGTVSATAKYPVTSVVAL